MKKMSKGTITALLVTVMAFSAADLFARGHGRGGDCPHRGYAKHHRGGGHIFRKLDFMKERLGLTDAQVKKIFDIHQKYEKLMFQNRGNVDKMMELRLERRKEIKKVLTTEQRKKYDEMFLKRMKRGPRGGHNCGDCPRRPRR